MRGIRGAITVENDNRNEIFPAVQKMLMEILLRNEIGPEDIGAALFSVTDDLTAAFPAAAARTLAGWDFVPLFDARQLEVEHSLQKCIRVLLLVNTDKGQSEIRHVYLGKAVVLRPDLANK